jgi:putative phosphoesterase
VKLGIISDSHGRADLVRRALDILARMDAQAIIHCGDIGGLDVLEELAGWRAWFVWGNTDFPRPSWQRHIEALQLPWPDGPLTVPLAGKRIAVFHGHELTCQQALAAAQHDYLLHGHTHQPDDYHIEKMRVINPGALHRVPLKTIALLDLATDELHFLPVEDHITSHDEDPFE